jgi:hypothetical protein
MIMCGGRICIARLLGEVGPDKKREGGKGEEITQGRRASTKNNIIHCLAFDEREV